MDSFDCSFLNLPKKTNLDFEFIPVRVSFVELPPVSAREKSLVCLMKLQGYLSLDYMTKLLSVNKSIYIIDIFTK